MAQSFIRIGTSRALTVPAGAIREAGFGDDTEFEFNLSPNGIEFNVKRGSPRKIRRKPLSARMKDLIDNPIVYTDEETERDERLKEIIKGI